MRDIKVKEMCYILKTMTHKICKILKEGKIKAQMINMSYV